MNVIVYDYPDFDKSIILHEVNKIVESEGEYITFFFESGEYRSIPKEDFNYIKIM